jgi:hypothetical protein
VAPPAVSPPENPDKGKIVDDLTPEPRPADLGLAGVSKELLLATYIDQVAPLRFTEEAKSTLIFETKRFISDVCDRASRQDPNAERVLRKCVGDSAESLRRKNDSLSRTVTDWSKQVGFTALGLTVAEWINIDNEKHIAHGSMVLLTIGAITTTCFLTIGFLIDKPWIGLFRRNH